MEYGQFKVEWPSMSETDNSDNILFEASQIAEQELNSDQQTAKGASNTVYHTNSSHYSDISEDDCDNLKMTKLVESTVVNSRQFGKTVSENELKDIVFSRLSPNTVAKSKWAVRTFHDWQNYRRTVVTTSAIKTFQGDLLQMTKEQLNDALGYFIVEIKKQDGSEYKGQTLYELISAIQYHLRLNGVIVHFLEDNEFIGMRNVLHAKMKELSRRGIGLDKKRADIISVENEDILWKKGILGSDTPKQLLDTIFYLIGLNFALRAGKEHRNLRYGQNSQLSLHTSESGDQYLQYTEFVSKTNQGGLKHQKHKKKVVRAYENLDIPERCIVRLYEKYIRLRPKTCACDAFYLQPAKLNSKEHWYNSIPVGVHTLQNLVKNMCLRGGMTGNFTNHSLRATAATRLYNAGVDEQLIAETTGHSSDAIRVYKRTSNAQLQDVSDIIQNKRKKCKQENIPKSGIQEPSSRELSIENEHFKFNLKF
ncbi:hypothetical protein SNE40_017154 [Patella caerulea]|uniref:Tyr recombinase domain-containing protein n=1 Tax=Patella caerulea TaxID=87958 RepID=A0AAN8JAJ6_PATCE